MLQWFPAPIDPNAELAEAAHDIVEASKSIADEKLAYLHRERGLRLIAFVIAAIVPPLIALFFAAAGPPFPRPVHTLIACAIIAVSHALATSFSGSMGYGGTLDPLVAGWAPSMIFGAAAVGMGIRLRLKLRRSG